MNKLLKNLILFVFLFLTCSNIPAWAACTGGPVTWYTTADEASVDSCISQADDGDTINVASGTDTWASVGWSNKNISLIGAGIGQTNITLSANCSISVVADTKAGFRVSGFTFSIGSGDGSTASIQFKNNTATARSGFRVDSCRFVTTENAGTGAHRIIAVIGLAYGLIDSCTFDIGHIMAGLSVFPYVEATETVSNMGRESWENNALDLGGPSAVYIEDCTFNYTGTEGQSRTIDAAYGSRIVYRHNTSTDISPMTHWNNGEGRRGPLKMEIYENSFIANRLVLDVGWLLGGTGVIFNNNVSGAGWSTANWKFEERRSCTGDCGGTNEIDKNTDGETGWACADQIGRGGGAYQSQPSVPFYIWNNGTAGVTLQGSCDNPSLQSAHIITTAHSNGDKDYCVGETTMPTSCGTHTNTYVSYTYPHPLRGAVTGQTTYGVTGSMVHSGSGSTIYQ